MIFALWDSISKSYLIQNWRPLSDMYDIQLERGNRSNISLAIEDAIKKIKERVHYALENGIETIIPSIIQITDGYGGNIDRISNTIKKKQEEKK